MLYLLRPYLVCQITQGREQAGNQLPLVVMRRIDNLAGKLEVGFGEGQMLFVQSDAGVVKQP